MNFKPIGVVLIVFAVIYALPYDLNAWSTAKNDLSRVDRLEFKFREAPAGVVSRFGSYSCRHFRPGIAWDTSGTLPYVSSANFLLMADFVLDEAVQTIEPSQVRNGDLIFVKSELAMRFFKDLYPFISKKFILITHNSSSTLEIIKLKHRIYLKEGKIIAWFAQNPGFQHSRHLSPTPAKN
jgi:hypothetical protein